jgi:hypothetical protein
LIKRHYDFDGFAALQKRKYIMGVKILDFGSNFYLRDLI